MDLVESRKNSRTFFQIAANLELQRQQIGRVCSQVLFKPLVLSFSRCNLDKMITNVIISVSLTMFVFPNWKSEAKQFVCLAEPRLRMTKTYFLFFFARKRVQYQTDVSSTCL